MPEISFAQEDTETAQETPAVVVVSEPVEVIPAQTSGYLTSVGNDTLESQPALAAPALLPALATLQSLVLAPTLTSPAPVNPTPALFSSSFLAPSPTIVLDTAPVPAQDLFPAPDAVLVSPLVQTPAPEVVAAPSKASPQVETIVTESQGMEAPDQVLIEDLGPDEEEDIPQDKDERADEGITYNSWECGNRGNILPA